MFNKLLFIFSVLFLLGKPSYACEECKALFQKAMEYKTSGNYLEAWRNLDKAMKLEPQNFEYKKQMADVQFNRRSYYDANLLNEEVLKQEPNNVEAIVRAAKINIYSNRFDKAIEYATKGLAVANNDDKNAMYEILANGFYGKKYYPQAIENYKKSIGAVAKVDIYQKMAKCYEGLSNYKEALVCYESALKLDDKQYSRYLDVANAAYMASNFDKAINYYNQAKDKGCPVDNNFYSSVGACFFDKGDFTNAVAMYNKAKEFSPYDNDTRYMITQCFYKAGDFKEARNSIEEYLAIFPDDADMIYMIGMTYFKENKTEKAENYFNKAFALKPELTKLRQTRMKF